MSARRVVITGMGWVIPHGCDIGAAWDRLVSGVSAIGPVTRFDAATFPTSFAAEVKGFDLADHLPAEAMPRHQGCGLHSAFALAAAARAWEQAGLDRAPDFRPERCGIYLGSGEGPLDTLAFMGMHLDGWDAEARRIDPVRFAEAMEHRLDPRAEMEQEPNAVLAHLASAFPCRGPSANCMTACAASTQSVGEGFEIIRRGDADAMLVGGSHSMISPVGMTGFIRLTAMSTRRDDPEHASRPFDRTRDGFVMGEGAGMLVIEGLDHARARGATILAELAGYGSTCDAYRITDIKPDGGGAQQAMRKTCEQAGIDPARAAPDGRPPIQYISAHGTGTSENDGIETAAVRAVFGDQAPRIPFSSVKSMIGHLIQAAGAVELMTCIQAIRTGIVPPTINLRHPDPACDLDHVPNEARDLRDAGGVEACLSNGFGFGGQNDCVCVRRYRE